MGGGAVLLFRFPSKKLLPQIPVFGLIIFPKGSHPHRRSTGPHVPRSTNLLGAMDDLFAEVRQRGILVYLSGTGADEIISDYGHGGEK